MPPAGGLRFCMISTFYPPFNFGGDGIAIERLTNGLARRGHRVDVIQDVDAYRLLGSGGSVSVGEDPPNVRVHRLSSRLGPISSLITHQTGRPLVHGKRMLSILEEGDFDVINFHNISLAGGPGVLALGSGIKIFMAHEHWLICPTHTLWRHNRERCDGRECVRCVLHHHRPPQLWRATGLLEREMEHVDVFVAMSEFSRRKHKEFGFPREMEVLPYFLPETGDPVASEQRSEEGAPHHRPYFLFVGRLEQIKGLDDVIPVFRDQSDVDLLIAGDGTYRETLESIAAGSDRVRFLGRIDSDQLGRYYEHAIASIVPSVCFETFGIVLIEAFRQRTPVIARNVGPIPEIVRKAGGGELFDDAEGLRVAIDKLRGDPDHRERLAASAFEAFQEHWTESAVIPRYLDLVERTAEEKGMEGVLRRLAAV